MSVCFRVEPGNIRVSARVVRGVTSRKSGFRGPGCTQAVRRTCKRARLPRSTQEQQVVMRQRFCGPSYPFRGVDDENSSSMSRNSETSSKLRYTDAKRI